MMDQEAKAERLEELAAEWGPRPQREHCRKCLYRVEAVTSPYGCRHLDVTGVTRLYRAVLEGIARTVHGHVTAPVEECPFWKDRFPYRPADSMESPLMPGARRRVIRKHTAEDQRRMELYERGLSDREIGEAVGKPATAIAEWRRRRKLPAHRKRRRI